MAPVSLLLPADECRHHVVLSRSADLLYGEAVLTAMEWQCFREAVIDLGYDGDPDDELAIITWHLEMLGHVRAVIANLEPSR